MKLGPGRWFGDTLNGCSIAGLALTETAYASKLKLPLHGHEYAYFCFVLSGGYTESDGKRSRLCRPSTLIFHPLGEAHSDNFHTATRCFNIQIDSLWLERAHQHAKVINCLSQFQGGLLAQLATRLYREFQATDELSPLSIEGLALEIIAEASRSSNKTGGKHPVWLGRVLEILHQHLSERLTLGSIAEAVGVHPVHLAREFRRFQRCTIGDYVRRLRIEFACRKLSTSETPLSAIALEAGFFDQSHFARTFKQSTGMSPATYRRLFRSR